jgi:hypothetical protein
VTTKKSSDGLTRRGALHVGLAAGVGALAAASLPEQAHAQAKIAQAMVKYQDHPNNGNHCGICAQFEPPNACKVVDGVIDPNGWCIAFAPKG